MDCTFASRYVRSIRVELLEVARLAPEQLHGRHSRDVLLQIRVDARNPDAHGPVRVANIPTKPLRDDPDERQHGERDDREPPVEPDHHRHDPDEREQIAEHRHDT